mmetsp:Transcript_42025/g.82219  ORF Transcript_42025/g.82219 Transcript_42025/m.82219 type:complete len:232 (+) Transcript_42025:43-738(+)
MWSAQGQGGQGWQQPQQQATVQFTTVKVDSNPGQFLARLVDKGLTKAAKKARQLADKLDGGADGVQQRSAPWGGGPQSYSYSQPQYGGGMSMMQGQSGMQAPQMMPQSMPQAGYGGAFTQGAMGSGPPGMYQQPGAYDMGGMYGGSVMPGVTSYPFPGAAGGGGTGYAQQYGSMSHGMACPPTVMASSSSKAATKAAPPLPSAPPPPVPSAPNLSQLPAGYAARPPAYAPE